MEAVTTLTARVAASQMTVSVGSEEGYERRAEDPEESESEESQSENDESDWENDESEDESQEEVVVELEAKDLSPRILAWAISVFLVSLE